MSIILFDTGRIIQYVVSVSFVCCNVVLGVDECRSTCSNRDLSDVRIGEIGAGSVCFSWTVRCLSIGMRGIHVRIVTCLMCVSVRLVLEVCVSHGLYVVSL